MERGAQFAGLLAEYFSRAEPIVIALAMSEVAAEHCNRSRIAHGPTLRLASYLPARASTWLILLITLKWVSTRFSQL
ncbi:MAG: hypothetical protein ACXVCM_07110 [Ktedonobacteraceae bacterium]